MKNNDLRKKPSKRRLKAWAAKRRIWSIRPESSYPAPLLRFAHFPSFLDGSR